MLEWEYREITNIRKVKWWARRERDERDLLYFERCVFMKRLSDGGGGVESCIVVSCVGGLKCRRRGGVDWMEESTDVFSVAGLFKLKCMETVELYKELRKQLCTEFID